jgi:pimeloyl-ACP methyl ester carboxylesterase
LIANIIKADPDSAMFTCDVRGIGESQPETCGANSFLSAYGSDYFYAIHSIMLDRPYVGQKAHDVLRVLDWLHAQGHEEIHLVTKDWGAIPATFAALLADGVKQVTLKNALTSYGDTAESEEYRWPLSSFVPGVLEKFDLPDCYRALTTKQLRQIEPWGALAQ